MTVSSSSADSSVVVAQYSSSSRQQQRQQRSTRRFNVVDFLFVAILSCCWSRHHLAAAAVVFDPSSIITSNINNNNNNNNHVIGFAPSSFINADTTNRAVGTAVAGAAAADNNRAPPSQWDDDILYDKEGQVGTWCAPSSPSTQPEASSSLSSSHKAKVQQQMSEQRHSFPVDADEIQETISSSSSSMADAADQQLPVLQLPTTTPTSGVDDDRLIRWVDAALRLVRIQAMEQQGEEEEEEEDEQQRLLRRRRRRKRRQQQQPQAQSQHPLPSDMNLYVAVSSSSQSNASSGGGNGRNRLMAVLPDGVLTAHGGSSSKAATKDAWLVLDPSPHLPFSHTVHVFGVTYDTPDAVCIANGGLPLEGDDCLNRVLKNRCSNSRMATFTAAGASASSSSRRRHGSSQHHQQQQQHNNCKVDFLPLVHYQHQPTAAATLLMQHDPVSEGSHPSSSHQHQQHQMMMTKQRLVCTNRVPGFAACPHLRPANETSELICDPLGTNHKRCDTTQDVVNTRCRLFETCDQAVLLSGGWNWQMSGHRPMAHLLAIYRMLRRNGFAQEAIKIFFANGVRAGKELDSMSADSDGRRVESMPSPSPPHHEETLAAAAEDSAGSLEFISTPLLKEEERHHHHRHHHRHHHEHHDLLNRKDNPAMYPSALKLALRNHLRSLCSSAHCVDSLVVYMSSATRSSDGASLLWDADVNGQADETEVYTVRELMRDVQDCSGARQVVVLADQNQSHLIIEALQKSKRHSNVVAFASGSGSDSVDASPLPTQTQTQSSSSSDQEGSSSSRSGGGELHLTHFWANYQHSHACLSKVFQDSLLVASKSAPSHHDGRMMPLFYDSSSSLSSSYNLFGAPCDAIPPYTLQELQTHFMGCQYIPTRLWMQKQISSSSNQQQQQQQQQQRRQLMGEDDDRHLIAPEGEEEDGDDDGRAGVGQLRSAGGEEDAANPPRLLSGGRR